MPGEQIVGSLGIRIVPVFDQFGEQVRSGLAPFQGMGGNMAASNARMQASSAAVQPMGGMPSIAGVASAQAAAQTMSVAAQAGNWTAHGQAADALAASLSGVAGVPATAAPTPFGSVMFYGGGTTGAFSSTRGGAFTAGGQFASVRTLSDPMSMSGAGQAEVANVIKQEVAAHQKLISSINKFSASMEQAAIESERVTMALRQGVHGGIVRSTGPGGGFGGAVTTDRLGAWGGLDPSNIFGPAISRGMANRRIGNIRAAIGAGGDFGSFGPPSMEDLEDAAAMESRRSRENPPYQRGMGLGPRQYAPSRPPRGSQPILPPSARMVLFNAMFGGWEVSQGMTAVDQGDFEIMMATSDSARIAASVRQQQGAWAGPFASMVAMGMNAFGAGPHPFLRSARREGVIRENIDTVRVLNATSGLNTSLNAAIAQGDPFTARRLEAELAITMDQETIGREIADVEKWIGGEGKKTTEKFFRAGGFNIGSLRGEWRNVNVYSEEQIQAKTSQLQVLRGQSKEVQDRNRAIIEQTQLELNNEVGRINAQAEAARWMMKGRPDLARSTIEAAEIAAAPPQMRDSMQSAFDAQSSQRAQLMSNMPNGAVGFLSAGLMPRFGMPTALQHQRDILSAVLGDNPVAAQLYSINAARDAQIAGLPAMGVNQFNEAVRRIEGNADLQRTIALRDDRRNREDVAREQSFRGRQMDFLSQNNPISAQAVAMGFGTIQAMVALDRQGPQWLERVQAESALGIKSLGVLKSDYLDAFRGRAFDPRLEMPSGHDVENPSVALSQLSKVAEEILAMLKTLTEN